MIFLNSKLRLLIHGAAAALLRHYKALVNDMGFENLFVKNIDEFTCSRSLLAS